MEKKRKRDNFSLLLYRNFFQSLIGGLTGGLGMVYFRDILHVTALDLGLISTASILSHLLLIFFSGWIVLSVGPKNIFILTSYLTSFPFLLYFLAGDATLLIVSSIISSVASTLLSPAWDYIILTFTGRSERVHKINLLNILSSIPRLIVPPVAAYLIGLYGDLPIIREIFLLQFILHLIVTTYIVSQLTLEERKKPIPPIKDFIKSLIKDYREVYKQLEHRGRRTWITFLTASSLLYISASLWPLYLREVINPPQIVYGLIPAVSTLGLMLMAYPVRRLSVTVGRKKTVLLLKPLRYIGITLLLLAYSDSFPLREWIPVLAWFLFGLHTSYSGAMHSMAIETLPRRYLPMWNSFRGFFPSIFSIPFPLIGAYLWGIDPRLPFLVEMILDIIRLYGIFVRIPETYVKLPPGKKKLPRHIIIYGLPESGVETTTNLLRRRIGIPPIMVGDVGLVERTLKKEEPYIISGDAGIIAAKEKEGLVVLLVAPKEERVKRKLRSARERGDKIPAFIAQEELEKEDKEVDKMVKKYLKSDFSKLPPFDIAINTERVPEDVVEEILTLLYRRMKRTKGTKAKRTNNRS